MTIPQLVAIGDNCLDVYLTKGFLTVGGNALNVAVHWHNSGRAARYLGAVGDDEAGRIVLAEIAAAGLPAADVEIRDGDTAVTLLADRLGDRTFLLEAFGVGEDFLPEPRHEASIAAADWVHLGTNANRDLVRRLAADGVRFSVDVSTAHDTLPLEGVALVFASGPDDAAMPVAPILSRLRAAGARQIVLTRGASGCVFDDGAALTYAAAVPVDVVDTCGAGDSFIAAFIAAYCCDGADAAAALGRAASAAAATCRHLGGFAQAPRPIPAWLPARHREAVAKAGAT